MHIERSKSVLVTGGAGFLGSHLCERLLDQGNDVICVDNFYTGSRNNIIHLLGNRRFEFIRHDVTFPLYVEVDQIYNLACPASPIHYQLDPVQTTKTSVHGAINMLGLAKRTKARILQSSTSEIYGDPEVHPQTEEYRGHVSSTGPRSCYDEGEALRRGRCSMIITASTHWKCGLLGSSIHTDLECIRTTVGSVSNFIVQALTGQPITLYGDGSQTRSFCYVDDLIEGLIRLMNSEGPNAHEPVNIGNPHEVSVAELAEHVVRLTGSRSATEHRPLPVDDPLPKVPGHHARAGTSRLGADGPARRGTHACGLLFQECVDPGHIG